MATKTKTPEKTEEKAEAPKAAKKTLDHGDITVNPSGPFIAGNTYTISTPAPDNTDGLMFQVQGAGYVYNLVPSFSDGQARGTFLAQTVGDVVVFFTQNGKTIASKTLKM